MQHFKILNVRPSIVSLILTGEVGKKALRGDRKEKTVFLSVLRHRKMASIIFSCVLSQPPGFVRASEPSSESGVRSLAPTLNQGKI